MTATTEEVAEMEKTCNEDEDILPEKISSFDSEGDATVEGSDRLHRFDMVLQHLHRLKSQINNNNNGIDYPPASTSDNSANSDSSLTESPQSPSKNKKSMFTKSDAEEKAQGHNPVDIDQEATLADMKDGMSAEKHLQKATTPVPGPPSIPPAIREFHKLQALKLLQQQNQYRDIHQNKERNRAQLPFQRYPQHFGGPLSHHPSHRHSPPLPLKLPPPMRHPFFSHNHHQPINQPNKHFYSNPPNSIRGFPRPSNVGAFSPQSSESLSAHANGPSSPPFPPVHMGNSNANYPLPPPPLTRFPMPPSLMRALAPNLANLAPHMIQPLLEEAKSRIAMMQAQMSQPPNMMHSPGSLALPPTSPPPKRYPSGNKLPPLFPPMMKDLPTDWGNPMLSSAADLKASLTSSCQDTPLAGCSSSMNKHRNTESTKDTGSGGKSISGNMELVNDFTSLEETFLGANIDERINFPDEDEDEDEIFLEEDVGVDDDDEDEEMDDHGVNLVQPNGIGDTALKRRPSSASKHKVTEEDEDIITEKYDSNLKDRNVGSEKYDPHRAILRKRKHSSNNDEPISIDNDQDKSGKESVIENCDEVASKSRRIQGGVLSPCPSTGGVSPPLIGSPGTPPLPTEARTFPPPFAYKLLEVRKATHYRYHG